MCAQVHDELDGWIKQDADLPAFKREMEDALTSIPLPGGVKLKVEGGFGPTWGDAH
jgi:DNA polymerase I-like protein with 3'-5' exonuclease and polymerase domains